MIDHGMELKLYQCSQPTIHVVKDGDVIFRMWGSSFPEAVNLLLAALAKDDKPDAREAHALLTSLEQGRIEAPLRFL